MIIPIFYYFSDVDKIFYTVKLPFDFFKIQEELWQLEQAGEYSNALILRTRNIQVVFEEIISQLNESREPNFKLGYEYVFKYHELIDKVDISFEELFLVNGLKIIAQYNELLHPEVIYPDINISKIKERIDSISSEYPEIYLRVLDHNEHSSDVLHYFDASKKMRQIVKSILEAQSAEMGN